MQQVEKFELTSAVLQEHPEDCDCADVVIKVEESDLILLLSQYEENRLNELDQPQHYSPPPDLVNAQHARVLLAWFDILEALPSVLKRISMAMKLRRKLLNSFRWLRK